MIYKITMIFESEVEADTEDEAEEIALDDLFRHNEYDDLETEVEEIGDD